MVQKVIAIDLYFILNFGLIGSSFNQLDHLMETLDLRLVHQKYLFTQLLLQIIQFSLITELVVLLLQIIRQQINQIMQQKRQKGHHLLALLGQIRRDLHQPQLVILLRQVLALQTIHQLPLLSNSQQEQMVLQIVLLFRMMVQKYFIY